MKLFRLLFLLLLPGKICIAQQIEQTNRKILVQKEDSLKIHAIKFLQGINATDRLKADSIFTRIFVRALSTTNSFHYSFDSVITVSKLYPPDSSFRIFTWQLVINDNVIRQHGAIQMNTKDGSLKLFPLIDKSDITENIPDTIGDNKGWIGAVYYRIIQTKGRGNTFYTLLGYDANNIRSSRKIIEVLSFTDGKPVFGGPYFSIPNSSLIPRNPSRYVMEFKKEANPRLTYDESLGMIIMEHLVSESNEPNKKFTLIPDGDYEALKWENGRWVYISKVFNEVTPEGKPPVPVPITESKLN